MEKRIYTSMTWLIDYLREEMKRKEHRMLPSPGTIVIVKDFKAYVSYTYVHNAAELMNVRRVGGGFKIL
jgi:hypothetical protein